MHDPTLTTLAEQSGFARTGRTDEVTRLCAAFAQAWPKVVHTLEFGRSAEGRPMRALIACRTDPRQVPLLMLQGGIHPGESDGKDAGFIALRELLGETASPGVLERIAILFVPAFNVDGHERFGRWNRPNQNGPEEMGWRTTAQNLNLNRDYTKADAPEMRSLLGLLRTWDPLVCADLHVTDGADFQPDISLQVEPVNQGDAQLCAAGQELRDALIAKVARSGSMPLPFYPDLATPDDPSSGFQLTVYSPRFSTGYFPQRNRFTVLVETHSWKDYATRVRVTRNTIVALAELLAAHGEAWREQALRADRAAARLAGAEVVLDYDSHWREPGRGEACHASGVEFTAAPFEGRMRVKLAGGWTRETHDIAAGALFVPIAQPAARLVMHLLEPQAPDSFAAWGFFNACFEQKEYLEPYVAEQIARDLLAKQPQLGEEFSRRLKEDPAFAASPAARREFFLRRHSSWDARLNLYPVLRVDQLLASVAQSRTARS